MLAKHIFILEIYVRGAIDLKKRGKICSQKLNIVKLTVKLTIQNCNSTKYTSVIHTNQK